jgi:predicted RND superfamily exporter protein
MKLKIAEFIIRHRMPVLILTLAVTAVFGWKIKDVRVSSETIDLFPSDHPYVETFVKYQDVFGGGNTALIAIEVNQGDIFNVETLDKVRRVTRAVELLPGINNYQVLSLAQRKVKDITVDFTPEGPLFKAEPVMWPEIPQTEEEIEALKQVVYSTPRIFGTLVSLDSKAALVVAGFLDRELEPPKLYAEIKKIVAAEEDENTKLYVIGRPVMLGFIMEQYPQLLYLFIATLAAIVLILLLYFRDARGVLVPLCTAAMSAIWGLGFIGFLGHNFDPLVIVVPFVISARALSHSVQFVERYFEEYARTQDRKRAAVYTFSNLFEPGVLSKVTDASGVFLVFLTPIPLMQKLAVMGGFWVLSIVVSNLVFNPVLFSFMPAPKPKKTEGKASLLDRTLTAIGGVCIGKGRWGVVAVAVVVGVVGFILASKLVIGDVNPGTPMLWPDSKYNQDTEHIAAKFGNTEILNVIVEGKSCPVPPREQLIEEHGCAEDLGSCFDDPAMACTKDDECFGCDVAAGTCRTDKGRACKEDIECVSRECNPIKSPVVLQNMEALQREMETLPEVGSSSSVAGLLPSVISAMHAGDPKWELIPDDRRDAGFFLGMIFSSSEPGDLSRFITQDASKATVTLYLRDHKGETLRKVVEQVKKFIAEHPMEEAEFHLASGYGGLLAAVNEVVAWSEARVTFLAFFMVFLLCAIAYKSIFAGLLFLVPLLVSNYITYAMMGALGIGLDVNALPVVSVGVGLGVDYGLYVVSRIQEEYAASRDLAQAIRRAISTAGKAVLFTATTMVAGIVFWAWSFLKFQADMGILLAVWMCVSMLGGLILLPTLISFLKPQFVLRAK